jgi:hypothetical protein
MFTVCALRSVARRRSRYQVQAHLPLDEPVAKRRPIGDLLALLVDAHQSDEEDADSQQPAPAIATA